MSDFTVGPDFKFKIVLNTFVCHQSVLGTEVYLHSNSFYFVLALFVLTFGIFYSLYFSCNLILFFEILEET